MAEAAKTFQDGLSQRIASLSQAAEYERAAELAIQGNLSAAENALQQLLSTPAYPPALDLHARIKVQQGDYAAAKDSWEQLLLIEPQHNNAKKALEQLGQIEQPKEARPSLKVTDKDRAVALLFILLFAGFTVWASSTQRTLANVSASLDEIRNNDPQIIVTFPAAEVERVIDASFANFAQTQQAELVSLWRGLEDTQTGELIAALKVNTPSPLEAPQRPSPASLGLTLAGVDTEAHSDGIEIHFREGLFLYETLLSFEGRELLKQVGILLEPVADQVTIEVSGFSDDIEAENETLRANRAVTVASFLIKETHIPDRVLVVHTTGNLTAPYRNDSFENRMRNRTVSLFLRWNNR